MVSWKNILGGLLFPVLLSYGTSGSAQGTLQERIDPSGIESTIENADEYSLKSVLDLEATFLDFDTARADSMADVLSERFYSSVADMPLESPEDAISMSEKLLAEFDDYFDTGDYQPLSLSLEKIADDSTYQSPASCVRISLLYSDVFTRYLDEHPESKVSVSVVNVGSESNYHALTRFDFPSGETVYFDQNGSTPTTPEELYEKYDVSEHAIDNDIFLQPRSTSENLAEEVNSHVSTYESSLPQNHIRMLGRIANEVDPDNVPFNYNHGLTLVEDGDYAGAKELAGRILDDDTASVTGKMLMSKATYEAGEYDEAIHWSKSVLHRDPHNFSAMHVLGMSYVESGDEKSAREYGEKLRKKRSYYHRKLAQEIYRLIE
ncbi:MAG: tetratricopeptide repeat protein [Nanoarchaeota archaeon]